MNLRRSGLGLALAILLVGCIGQETPRQYGKPGVALQLDATGLDESSGVAPSYEKPGWFYTHNDNGETMRFWRFNLKGDVEGPFTMPGIVNRDVEDLASLKTGAAPQLYFADIGDNAAAYPNVRVYRCREPKGAGGTIRPDVFTLQYPDGSHNAEAFFVEPKSHAFWIVTKNQKAAGVYWLAEPKANAINQLKKLGEIRLPGSIPAMRLVTGAAVSPLGERVVIRTYTAAYEFTPSTFFTDWFQKKPREVKIGIDGIGEGICYDAEGSDLVTTAEGKPCPVTRIPLSSGL